MSEEKNEKVGTITIKKDDLWKYSTFLLLAVLVIGGFTTFGKDSAGSSAKVTVGAPSAPSPSPVVAKIDVSIDDDPMLGNKNAPVTIIEFSDYECPFCGRFYIQTLPQIKAQYIDTGKVRFIYRDFPLSFHPSAQSAAEAAECVRDKGGDEAYFKYHDKIFENQAQLSLPSLKIWATDLGYNIESCLDSGKFKAEVQKDFNDGQVAGVQGTPGFFINGKSISGAQPFQVFQQAIEAELV